MAILHYEHLNSWYFKYSFECRTLFLHSDISTFTKVTNLSTSSSTRCIAAYYSLLNTGIFQHIDIFKALFIFFSQKQS